MTTSGCRYWRSREEYREIGSFNDLHSALVTPATSHVPLLDIVGIGDDLFRLVFVVWAAASQRFEIYPVSLMSPRGTRDLSNVGGGIAMGGAFVT
jgi:hypothetical protein